MANLPDRNPSFVNRFCRLNRGFIAGSTRTPEPARIAARPESVESSLDVVELASLRRPPPNSFWA